MKQNMSPHCHSTSPHCHSTSPHCHSTSPHCHATSPHCTAPHHTVTAPHHTVTATHHTITARLCFSYGRRCAALHRLQNEWRKSVICCRSEIKRTREHDFSSQTVCACVHVCMCACVHVYRLTLVTSCPSNRNSLHALLTSLATNLCLEHTNTATFQQHNTTACHTLHSQCQAVYLQLL